MRELSEIIRLLLRFRVLDRILFSIILSLIVATLDLLFYVNIIEVVKSFGNQEQSEFLILDKIVQSNRIGLVIYLLVIIAVVKNFFYLFNLRILREMTNDVERLCVEENINIIANCLSKSLDIGSESFAKPDVFYSNYIVRFINNIFTPFIKIIPEITISVLLIIYLSITETSYFFITLLVVIVLIPIINRITRLSSKTNDIIIANITGVITRLKYISQNFDDSIVNKNYNSAKSVYNIIDENKLNYKTVITYNNLNRPLVEVVLIILILAFYNFNTSGGIITFFILFLRLIQQLLTISTSFAGIRNNLSIINEISSIFSKDLKLSSFLTDSVYVLNDRLINFSNFLSSENTDNGIVIDFGPSGTGKSSILRQGILDEKISLRNTFDKVTTIPLGNFKYVPQTPEIFLTIADDLEINGIQIDDFKNYLNNFHITLFNNSFNSSRLSGGMLIFYNLLKNLFLYSNYNLVVDEPTNGLDSSLKSSVFSLLQYHSQNHKIIVITHDDFLKKRLVDSIEFMTK